MTNDQAALHLQSSVNEFSSLASALAAASARGQMGNVNALARDTIEKLITIVQFATLANKELTAQSTGK